MLFTAISASTPAVSVTVNNTNSAGSGWFSSLLSGLRSFAENHPYATYAIVDRTAGIIVYFVGGHFVGQTSESRLADPASTARLIQTNANLRAEMDAPRNSLNEVRDALAEVKLELAHVQGNSLVELTQ